MSLSWYTIYNDEWHTVFVLPTHFTEVALIIKLAIMTLYQLCSVFHISIRTYQ